MSDAANTSISQIDKNNMMNNKIICHFEISLQASNEMMGVSSSPLSADLSPAPDNHVNVDLPPVSEQIMQTLSELAKSFQDMADRCLLVLHLEVRYDFKYKTS